MDNILSKKYIDITINNTTTGNINLDFSKESSSAIVDEASNYDLSIIRFKIPSSNIQKFIIPAYSEDYKLYMRKNNIRDGNNILSKSVTKTFNLNSGNNTDVVFKEPKEFIDYLNRSISECYFNYITDFIPSNILTSSLSFNFQNTNLLTQQFNFGTFPTVDGINYIKLNISIQANDVQQILHNLKIFLIVDSRSILLLQNPEYTTIGQVSNIVFSDSFHISSDASYVTGLSKNRYPKEPIFSLYETGNLNNNSFSIRIACSNTFPNNDMNFAINSTLTLSTQVINDFLSPRYTPYFSINDNNFLTFNYSDNWSGDGPHLGFSPRLRNILDNFEYITFNNIEYLSLPSVTLDNSEVINKNITQLQSSLYLFNQINKIELTSIIPVEFENVAGATTSGILTDFAIDTATISSDYFIYNASNDYRKYRLLSNTPLKKLQFTGWIVYNDGTRKIITIRQGETANLKIQLSPI